MPRIQPYWLGPRWTQFPSQNGTGPANGWITQLPGEIFWRGKASPYFQRVEPMDQHGEHHEKNVPNLWTFSFKVGIFLPHLFWPMERPLALPVICKMSIGRRENHHICKLQFLMTTFRTDFDHISNLTLLLSSIANILNRQVGEDQVVASLTLKVILAKKMLRSRIYAKVNDIFDIVVSSFQLLVKN